MRKFVRSLVLVPLLALVCLSVVFAHPGFTDPYGGHYDAQKDEYHYHHSYPAHQHQSGECPYNFYDRSTHTSGTNIGGTVIYPNGESYYKGITGLPDLLFAIPPSFWPAILISLFIAVIEIRHRIAENKRRRIEKNKAMAADLSSQIAAIKRRYNSVRSEIQSSVLIPPAVAMHIPPDSFLGLDNLPHQIGITSVQQDKYYFAFNTSSGMVHRLSCQHGRYLTPLNIFQLPPDSPYRPYMKKKFCLLCHPVFPDVEWAKDYRALRDALSFFHLKESDLRIDRSLLPKPVRAPVPAPPERPKPLPIAPPDPPPIPESEPKPTVKVDTIPHKELPPAPAHETKPEAAPDAPSRLDLSDRITIGYKGQSVTLYGVPSSFISHIGYVRKDKLLFVRMKPSSRVYIYFKVPYSVCSGFVRAESIGSFYNDNIKDAFRGTLFGFVFDKSN